MCLGIGSRGIRIRIDVVSTPRITKTLFHDLGLRDLKPQPSFSRPPARLGGGNGFHRFLQQLPRLSVAAAGLGRSCTKESCTSK